MSFIGTSKSPIGNGTENERTPRPSGAGGSSRAENRLALHKKKDVVHSYIHATEHNPRTAFPPFTPLFEASPGKGGRRPLPTAVGKSSPRLFGAWSAQRQVSSDAPARRPSWSSLTKPSRLIEQRSDTAPFRGGTFQRLGIGAAIVVAPVAFVLPLVGSSNPTTSDQQHELAPRTRDDIVWDIVGAQCRSGGQARRRNADHRSRFRTDATHDSMTSAISSRVVSFRRPRSTTGRRSPVQVSNRATHP